AFADDVSGPEDARREAVAFRLIEQPGLDRRLLRAVFAERVERLVLGCRYGRVVAIDPDRAAVQEVLHPAPQRGDEVLGAGQREADHVDDDLRLERGDPLAERSRLLLGGAVDRYLLDARPGGVGRIGTPLPPADIDDLVAGRDQPRHEIGP